MRCIPEKARSKTMSAISHPTQRVNFQPSGFIKVFTGVIILLIGISLLSFTSGAVDTARTPAKQADRLTVNQPVAPKPMPVPRPPIQAIHSQATPTPAGIVSNTNDQPAPVPQPVPTPPTSSSSGTSLPQA
jgi:hypothetical protein